MISSRPKEPGNGSEKLQSSGNPQDSGSTKGAARQNTAHDGTNEEQEWRPHAAVSLRVVECEQLGVGEQVAVDARQDDTGERVVLERPARDGLAAALESDQGHGNQDVPVDAVLVVGRGGHQRKHAGGSDDKSHLDQERSAQDPSPTGREVPVETTEAEGSHTERDQRDPGLDPAFGLMWGS